MNKELKLKELELEERGLKAKQMQIHCKETYYELEEEITQIKLEKLHLQKEENDTSIRNELKRRYPPNVVKDVKDKTIDYLLNDGQTYVANGRTVQGWTKKDVDILSKRVYNFEKYPQWVDLKEGLTISVQTVQRLCLCIELGKFQDVPMQNNAKPNLMFNYSPTNISNNPAPKIKRLTRAGKFISKNNQIMQYDIHTILTIKKGLKTLKGQTTADWNELGSKVGLSGQTVKAIAYGIETKQFDEWINQWESKQQPL